MTKINSRQTLLQYIAFSCFEYIEEGRQLHSGYTSKYFIDIPKLVREPDGMMYLTGQMTNLLLSVDDIYISGFISPDTGGTLIATALQQYLAVKHDKLFPIFRYSKTGTFVNVPKAGRYIIIDDVITTASTIKPIIEESKTKSFDVCQVVTVVNRQEIGEFGNEGRRFLSEKHIPLASVFTIDEIQAIRLE